MTTFGVALHRSFELWLQRAGQSSCSMYDGLDTTETARAYIRKTRTIRASLHTATTAFMTKLQHTLHVVHILWVAINTMTRQCHCPTFYECLGPHIVLHVVLEVQTNKLILQPLTLLRGLITL